MRIDDERIEDAVRHTEILRLPKRSLATFGTTNITYYMVTKPVYVEITEESNETIVREGRVIAERPRIVTPYYMSQLEGFSTNARRYFNTLIQNYGENAPGLFYTYRNEPGKLSIVTEEMKTVLERLNIEIEKRGDPLTTIIKGQDELWDVSLMRFIYEITSMSMQDNLTQFLARGLIDVDKTGVPMDARMRIEELFIRMAKGELNPDELRQELHRWNLFEEYQDRFFKILQRR
ncbi:MAG: hypothetical protein JSV32_05775 [Dehalococcoidia bacterium]|nr:MAG: hypothetical protein JSV32_05775 [Dehalococcoidia bacterium]